MLRIHQAALAALIVIGVALSAAARQSVTLADIQRLQDNAYLAGADVSQLRSRDAARASQLQAELDDLREESIYLKVKFRKERSVLRSEYVDVRDRIDGLRSRARGDAASVAPPPAAPNAAPAAVRTTPAPARGTTEIPAGTEMEVRLSGRLNSGTTRVEDRFEATTLVNLTVGGVTAVPAGSVVRGVVTDVQPATRTNRTARMTVSFDQVTVSGRAYPIRGTVTQAIEG